MDDDVAELGRRALRPSRVEPLRQRMQTFIEEHNGTSNSESSVARRATVLRSRNSSTQGVPSAFRSRCI